LSSVDKNKARLALRSTTRAFLEMDRIQKSRFVWIRTFELRILSTNLSLGNACNQPIYIWLRLVNQKVVLRLHSKLIKLLCKKLQECNPSTWKAKNLIEGLFLKLLQHSFLLWVRTNWRDKIPSLSQKYPTIDKMPQTICRIAGECRSW